MKRRDFLKLTLYSSVMAGMGLTPSRAFAAGPYRTLVNIMCLGGADFRYMFGPNPSDTAYVNKFWDARSSLYSGHANYASAWSALYSATSTGFGIHNSAGWLKTQYDAGNVAIVCNVVGSSNRQHDHSQIIVNTGDLNASRIALDRDGWGGRLAEEIGAANVVAMSHDVSTFCKGTDPTNRMANVIHASDTRNFALSEGNNATSQRMARALKNYYKGKQLESTNKPTTWPYHKFIQHEKKLRDFGDPFKALTDANPIPPALLDIANSSSANRLNRLDFAKQCKNLYDSFTGAELFKLRVAALEYGGWDTHRSQQTSFANNISDLFGTNGGLATLTNSLPSAVVNNTVFVFTSDFGRQLRANGDNGTDHGRGNYMILIGPSVKGGVYGEMHPRREISTADGPAPFDVRGADILGQTSFERVLGRLCDWVEPGSGVKVFPNMAHANLNTYPDGPILEPGVDLSSLLV